MADHSEITESERMVLRTVYLPPDLDEKLRVWAFRTKVSKGDVIRQAVARELASVTGFGDDVQVEKSPPKAKKGGGRAKPTAAIASIKPASSTAALVRARSRRG